MGSARKISDSVAQRDSNEVAREIEELRSLPMFRNHTTASLRNFTNLLQFKNFTAGEVVIAEGSAQEAVILLLEGRVAVFKGEALLGELWRRGDVLNESAVSSPRPSQVKVVALAPTRVCCADLLELRKSFGNITEIEAVLYPAMAEILGEDPALFTRNLENLVEHLNNHEKEALGSSRGLAQQNLMFFSNLRRLNELSRSKDMLFQKLSHLTTFRLEGVKATLVQHQNSMEGEPRLRCIDAVREIEDTIAFIHPLIMQYASERAIQDKRVLLAESNKKQQIVTKMALGGTGVDLEIASDVETGKRLLGEANFDILFANSDMLELVPAAKEKNPNIRLVFVTSDDVKNSIQKMRKYGSYFNLVSRNEKDRMFTVKTIVTTVSKLINKDLFGVDKYLAWGADVQQHPITSSDTRRDLIEEMSEYFASLGVRKTVIERARTAAEEMLMNAIYDAPTDSQGRPLYNHLPRTTAVNLRANQQGIFKYACDGIIAAVSVEDPFGALTRETVFDYLEKCYSGNLEINDSRKGGGGLGLFQVVGTSDLVVFNVKSKIKTEVLALFNVDIHAGKNAGESSLHFFYD